MARQADGRSDVTGESRRAKLSSPTSQFGIAPALCALAGVLLRLALIVRSGWRIDYDEAVVGLLGLRVLHGERMAFLPASADLGRVRSGDTFDG